MQPKINTMPYRQRGSLKLLILLRLQHAIHMRKWCASDIHHSIGTAAIVKEMPIVIHTERNVKEKNQLNHIDPSCGYKMEKSLKSQKEIIHTP